MKWTVPFVSLNGTSCHVDIYKIGYTGSTVTTLTGATTPFTYEEDDSHDLLNDTIRYKTGYLRLIETTNGSLSELFPSSDFEHYIEFYYGNRLDFIGFMQAQDFSNGYLPAPKEIDFPVASPLWLTYKRTFEERIPQNVSLGALLDEILTDIGVYTRIMFPYYSDIKLDNTIYSEVICPFNSEFQHTDQATQRNPVYNPMTYDYLLDAICKAFGWVLHDDVQQLVFSQFDYTGTYCYYNKGEVGDPSKLHLDGESGGTVVEIEDSFTFADNSAKENQIMPFNHVKMEYEGEMSSNEILSFDRTYYLGIADFANLIHCCFLQAVFSVHEIDPYGIIDTFDTNGRFSSVGVHVVAFYTFSDKNVREGIAYALKDNEQENATLFTVRLYTKFTSKNWQIEYKLESGVSLNDIDENDTDHRYGVISTARTIDSINGYVEWAFKVTRLGNTYAIDRWISTWENRDTMFFSDIRFYTSGDNPLDKYSQKTSGFDIIGWIKSSFENGNVTLPISMYRSNDRQIGFTIRSNMTTQYEYLLKRRNELQAKFKVISMPSAPWCKLWQMNNSSYRWRIIAQTFDPWNDDMTLTIERSETLEN